jgi:hypothetical protein
MIICALSGLISPLGAKTSYTYLYKTLIGDTTQYINEHLPTVLINNISMLLFIIVLLGLLIFTKVKIRLSDLFLVGGLGLLSLMSSRQTSMLVLLGSFVLVNLVQEILTPNKNIDSDKIVDICCSHPIYYFYLLIFVIGIASTPISENINSKFIDETIYPVKATEYILDNLDIENIKLFNEYDYGSYLLFNNIPVFIDSRCDLYTPEYNGENCTVFDDFMDVQTGNTYCEEIFEKYDITHIIISKDSLIYTEIVGANNGKYNELYSDDYFAVFERII